MSDEDVREGGEVTEAEEPEAAEEVAAEDAVVQEVAETAEDEEVAESAAGADAEEPEAEPVANADEALTCGDELGDDYELVELELSEDDIVRYLEDDEGNQIGFVVMEDGKECEYLYVEEDDEEADAAELDNDLEVATPDDGSLGITRDGVQAATDDMNAIFKDGVKVAAEMKGAFDDIKSALDFSSLLK